MKVATDEQITQLRRHAVNSVTREIMTQGIKLSWEQAHDLGDEALDWMRTRLGLKTSTSDHGVTFKPDPGAARSHATRKVAGALVTVETMPDYLHESHRAARNWGAYPHNGAVRERMSREEAEEIVEADPDGYAHIVVSRTSRSKRT